MIGSLKAPFFKTDMFFEEAYMPYIKIHLTKEEKFIKTLPPYKSGDIVAFFTDKRIIFTGTPDSIGSFDKSCEIEFLPYKSIQRFSFLAANIPNSYKLDIIVSEKTELSFFVTDSAEAVEISQLIGTSVE